MGVKNIIGELTINGSKVITEDTLPASSPIIYATEKPSTPAQAIYVITEDEVVSVDVYQDGVLFTEEQAYCEIVDALPDEPTLAVDLTTQFMYAYYLTTENTIKAYFDEETAMAVLGAAITGWIDLGTPFASVDDISGSGAEGVAHTQPKTRVYVPLPDGAFLELTSGIRTRFDEKSGTVSITEM